MFFYSLALQGEALQAQFTSAASLGGVEVTNPQCIYTLILLQNSCALEVGVVTNFFPCVILGQITYAELVSLMFGGKEKRWRFHQKEGLSTAILGGK